MKINLRHKINQDEEIRIKKAIDSGLNRVNRIQIAKDIRLQKITVKINILKI